jgi:hypothetical protein
MAAQIADGLCVVNVNSLRTFAAGELMLLRQELEKIQRETRAVVPPPDDAQACQLRNRRIGRLAQAVQMIANKQSSRP